MPSLGNHNGDGEGSYGRKRCSSFNLLNEFHRSPTKRVRISPPYSSRGGKGKMECSSIEILPDECLYEILKRLSGARERSTSACVSKHWLSLLSSIHVSDYCMDKTNDYCNYSLSDEEEQVYADGYLERTITGMNATDNALAGIAIGTARRGGLGQLYIRGSHPRRGVTNYGLSAIGHGCPLLKSLFLYNISSIGDDGLVEIAKGCPNLTTLYIDSCYNIGNMSLQAIGKHCSKIKSVAIKDCPLIRILGVYKLLSLASNVLTSLKLQSLNIDHMCIFVVIGYLGLALRSLELCGLQQISQKGFMSMKKKIQYLRLLESLTLTSCNGVTDLSLELIGKACPNLKHMVLIKCSSLSDDGLVAFVEAARSLESLQLEECHKISEIGLICALSSMSKSMKSLSIIQCLGIKCIPPLHNDMLPPRQSLQFLSIHCSPGFSVYSLNKLAELCTGLHTLDLSGLTEITDDTLRPFIKSLKSRLVNVNLSRCVNLTDKPIIDLVTIHEDTLEVLNLEGCRNITDASMKAIANIAIQDLNVSECSITDDGLCEVCDQFCPNIYSLSISGCSMISEISLFYIKMLDSSLCNLNVKNCKSLSMKAIRELKKEMSTCAIFYL